MIAHIHLLMNSVAVMTAFNILVTNNVYFSQQTAHFKLKLKFYLVQWP